MSRPTVLLLSGPNLNLLGIRDPEVYGTNTLEDHVKLATVTADGLGLDVEHHQSDREGELVERIQGARGRRRRDRHQRGGVHPLLVGDPRCAGHLRRPDRRAAHLEPRTTRAVAADVGRDPGRHRQWSAGSAATATASPSRASAGCSLP